MHQGNEEEIWGRTEETQTGNPKKRKKKMEEKGLERLKRKQAGRRGNRSKGGKYEKRGETGVY